MITARVIGVSYLGVKTFVQYALTDGKDGQIEVPLGSSVDYIKSQLAAIVDAANYADSIKPLVDTEVVSAVPPPEKVVKP